MNKKKVIKTILVVLLSLIVIFVAAAVAVFQFVIKPNSKVIIDAVEQIITDEEFIKEFEIEDIPEDLVDEALSDITPDDENVEGIEESPKPVKPKTEYKNTYDYIKDNVESADLKKGISFASRVDVSYILGLLKGGLTVPEKRELKAYLKERFSNSEINDGISLYNKYSYLLK
ncbi:MAG: hypothetical protein IKK18_00700 [Clostridia bacterium]|nr:hypothetical protein [Clostridia bacterium]